MDDYLFHDWLPTLFLEIYLPLNFRFNHNYTHLTIYSLGYDNQLTNPVPGSRSGGDHCSTLSQEIYTVHLNPDWTGVQ